MHDKQRVLILCTGNSARSQMAEGLLRERAGDRFEAHSAGSNPSGHVLPGAIEALNAIGIDIHAARSKHMQEFYGQTFDYVLTVCDNAAENCPVFPGPGVRHHRNFTDPAAYSGDEQRAVFFRVRDEIDAWLASLFDIAS